jgi:signal recognition particle subunit SRP14
VFLSQKSHPSDPSQVLIRATNGKSKEARKENPDSKTKLRTLVQLDEVAGFYQRYSEVCKKGMEQLRKRDKKKAKAKKKGKAKKPA